MTFEIAERIAADGSIHQPLDEDQARGVINRLKTLEVEAVGVCLLWSTVNGRHEDRLGALLDRHLPGVPYTLSQV